MNRMKLHSDKLETEKYLAFNWDWFFISSTIITSIHRNERSKKRIRPKPFIEENNSEIEIKRLRSKLRQIYLKFFCWALRLSSSEADSNLEFFCLFYSSVSNCLYNEINSLFSLSASVKRQHRLSFNLYFNISLYIIFLSFFVR